MPNGPLGSQVCVAYDCVYLESNFYAACDCDSNGERRAEWGPEWWREFTHCEDFTCLYVREKSEACSRGSPAWRFKKQCTRQQNKAPKRPSNRMMTVLVKKLRMPNPLHWARRRELRRPVTILASSLHACRRQAHHRCFFDGRHHAVPGRGEPLSFPHLGHPPGHS